MNAEHLWASFLARFECDETVRMGVKPARKITRRERRAREREDRKSGKRRAQAVRRLRAQFKRSEW